MSILPFKIDKRELLKVAISSFLAFILTFSPILPSFKLEHFKLLGALTSEASYITWTGAGSDNRWSNQENWNEHIVPGADDVATFNGTSIKDVLIENDISVAGIQIDEDYNGTVTLTSTQRITVGTDGITQKGGTFDGGQTPMIVYGSVKVMAGHFIAPKQDLEIKQHLAVFTDQFDHNTGTIYFTGGDQVIVGSVSLNNFIKQVTAYHNLQLQSGSLINIQGKLTLSGTILAPLDLRSSIDGQPASINAQGGADVSFVDVKDIINIGNIISCPDTCINSGNNNGWTLPSLPASIAPSIDQGLVSGVIDNVKKVVPVTNLLPPINAKPSQDQPSISPSISPEPGSEPLPETPATEEPVTGPPALGNPPQLSPLSGLFPAKPLVVETITTPGEEGVVSFDADQDPAFTLEFKPVDKAVIFQPIDAEIVSKEDNIEGRTILPSTTPAASPDAVETPSTGKTPGVDGETPGVEEVPASPGSTPGGYVSTSPGVKEGEEPSRVPVISPTPAVAGSITTTAGNTPGVDGETPGVKEAVTPSASPFSFLRNFFFASADAEETTPTPSPSASPATEPVAQTIVTTAALLDPDGALTSIKPIIQEVDGTTTISLAKPASNFRPGKYTLQVTVTQDGYISEAKQDFTWGVLAMNINQSTYQVGETAQLGFGVLDNYGRTICDAVLSLDITSPSGQTTTLHTPQDIQISPDCGGTTHTVLPDYQTAYIPDTTGTYNLLLTAQTKNGTRRMRQQLEATSDAPFVTKRESATRLYPPTEYSMSVTLTANQPFTGSIVEPVPPDFAITNISNNGELITEYKETPSTEDTAVVDTPGTGKTPGVDGETPGVEEAATAATPGVSAGPDSPGVEVGPTPAVEVRNSSTGKTPGVDGETPGVEEVLSPGVGDEAAPQVARQYIIWHDITLQANDSLTLTYTYDAPDISPEFYLLGPLQLIAANDKLSAAGNQKTAQSAVFGESNLTHNSGLSTYQQYSRANKSETAVSTPGVTDYFSSLSLALVGILPTIGSVKEDSQAQKHSSYSQVKQDENIVGIDSYHNYAGNITKLATHSTREISRPVVPSQSGISPSKACSTVAPNTICPRPMNTSASLSSLFNVHFQFMANSIVSLYHKIIPTAWAQEGAPSNTPDVSGTISPSYERGDQEGVSEASPSSVIENSNIENSLGIGHWSLGIPEDQVLWSEPHAWQLAADASLYWIGASGGSNNTASNWSTTNPTDCTGTPSGAAPGTSDIIIFDPDCDNNMALDVSESVAGVSFVIDYIGTVTQAASVTLTVGTSDYIQAGGTFVGGDSAITFNDAFTQSNGAFTVSSGTTTFIGSVTISGGTFNHNSGTIAVTGSSTTWDVSTSLTVNDFTVSKGSSDTLTIADNDTIVVNGTTTLTDGLISQTTIPAAGSVAAQGDVTVGSLFDGGTATLTFAGSAAQTYTDSGGNEPDGDITINKPSGTVTLASAADWNVAGQDITITQGVLNLAGNALNMAAASLFTIEAEGTLALNGTETIPTIDTNNGTVMYNGTGEYNGLKAGDSYNNLIINNGLTGYWKLDDGTGTTTVSDSSGYRYGLTTTNGTAWESAAKPSLQYSNPYTLSFDGSDDYAIGSDFLDASDTADLSISGWFKRSSSDTDDTIIAKKNSDEASDLGWLLKLNDTSDTVNFTISDGANQYNLESTTAYTSTGWHHFTAVWDQDSAANSEIFLDGLDDNATDTGTIANIGDASNAVNFTLGAESDAGEPFHGYLDDLKIYNHVLSEQEINSLAAGSISPTGTGLQMLDANLDVNGDLTLNSGELDVSSSNYTINVAGAFENNGALFNPRTSTVTLDGTTGSHELQSGGQSFNNLTVSGNGGTWTLQDDLDVNGTYAQSNGTLNTNSTDNWTIHANDFDQTAGTFTPNTSTVVIDSASNQTIQAASSLYNLQTEDPTETSLVGYWKFDEGQGTTAADSSGSGNTGTLTNAPKWTTTVTSTISYDNPYSLDFDGTNDYLQSDYRLSSPFPLSAMVYSRDVTNINTWFYDHGTFLNFYNESSRFKIWAGSEISGTIPIANNTWYHVAVTYDGTTISQYVDGSLDVAADRSLTLGADFRLGYHSMGGRSWDGHLDDVRIYSAALSAPEIANLSDGHYANGDSGTATFTLNANLDINNSLTLQSGILDVSATPYNITLAQDWNNYSGASGFTDQTGTVTLDGTNQTIRGTTTFYNLTDQETSTDTLTFETGKTQTIAGTLNFDGASSNLLSLRSSVPTTRYTLDVTSPQTLTYVNAQDSNASTSDITCLTDTCVNGGNNDNAEASPHWAFFASFQAAVSGFWNIGTTWGGACSGSCTEGTDYPSSVNTATIPTYKVTLNGTAAASNLSVSSGGSLNLSGYDLTVANDFVLNPEGTLIAQGSETIPTIDTNNGTVMYNGTGEYNGLKAGDSYNNLIINNGLVSYWKFDDGTGTTVWSDSSGYGNHGTGAGATGANNTPQANANNAASLNFSNPYALDFDGTDDYITVPDSDSLDIGTNDITVTAWLKTSQTYGGVFHSLATSSCSANPGFNVRLVSGKLAGCIANSGSSTDQVVSGSLVNDGNWHHAVWVFDRDDKLYAFKDGVKYSGLTISSINGTVSNNETKYLGSLSGPSTYFNGLLDDVRIYNHALTEQEINTLAAGSISPTGTGLQMLDANLDVNGDLTLNSGELDVSSANYTITVAGSFDNNGALFNPRTSTVTLDGTSGSHELQSGGQSFNNLTVSGSGGTWTLQDDLDVNGTLAQSSGTLNTNSTDNWTIHANDFDQTAGTFTPNTSTVVIDSASNQTIQAASSLYNLQTEDPTESNLVGYWKFDEGQGTTAADSSGSGNTGTLTNAPKWSTTVTSTISYDNPYSLDFDGTDDYVNVGSIAPQNAFTISVWAKRDTVSSTYDVIYSTNANYAGLIVYDNGSIALLNTDGYVIKTWVNVWTDKTEWHHITYTQSATGASSPVELFFDGVSVGSDTVTTETLDSFTIGEFVTLFSERYFGGTLDDVRIYSAALSAPEIANLSDGHYANGDSGTATFTLNANLDINNSLTLQSGILDVSATPYNITLAKDWNNYGGASSFTDQTGTVTLDGTSQTIRGTTTFNNLTDQETTSDTLTFETGKTQTIAGTLNFDGAISNLLSLRSSVPTTRYTLDVTSPQTLTYINTQDSNASTSDITCLDTTCVNGGNNDNAESTPHWVFTAVAARSRIMIISLLNNLNLSPLSTSEVDNG